MGIGTTKVWKNYHEIQCNFVYQEMKDNKMNAATTTMLPQQQPCHDSNNDAAKNDTAKKTQQNVAGTTSNWNNKQLEQQAP